MNVTTGSLIICIPYHQACYRPTMKCTLALASLFVSWATAFVPSAQTTQSSSTALNVLNGWLPDADKFTYGLPGATSPFREGFDPFGITERESFETLKTFRESEVTHGRVAMLAGTYKRLLSYR
jgi:hypothetical protein